MLGVSQKRVGAPLHGKHMASLFLKGAATVCAERHTRLELLHKLYGESNQFLLYMVFKTVNATNISRNCAFGNYFLSIERKCVKGN